MRSSPLGCSAHASVNVFLVCVYHAVTYLWPLPLGPSLSLSLLDHRPSFPHPCALGPGLCLTTAPLLLAGPCHPPSLSPSPFHPINDLRPGCSLPETYCLVLLATLLCCLVLDALPSPASDDTPDVRPPPASLLQPPRSPSALLTTHSSCFSHTHTTAHHARLSQPAPPQPLVRPPGLPPRPS